MGVKWIPKYYWFELFTKSLLFRIFQEFGFGRRKKNDVGHLDSILKFLVYWEIHCWPLLCKDNEIFVISIFPDTRAHKPLMQIAIFLNDFGLF